MTREDLTHAQAKALHVLAKRDDGWWYLSELRAVGITRTQLRALRAAGLARASGMFADADGLAWGVTPEGTAALAAFRAGAAAELVAWRRGQ